MNRRTPYLHDVKRHKRRSPKGKLVSVSHYKRGKGKPRIHKTIKSFVPEREREITRKWAEHMHKKRSRTAQMVDEGLRAPLTSDPVVWAHAPNEYDILGIDTPGDNLKGARLPISGLTGAQINMNQIGGYYRVDVWNKEGNRVHDKYGFKDKAEAELFVKRVKDANKGRSDEDIKNLKAAIEKNVMTTTAIDHVMDLIKKDEFLSSSQKKELTEYAKELRSEKEEPLVLAYEEKPFKPTLTNEQIMRNLGVTPTKKSGVEASYNMATGWMRIVFDEKPSRETLDKLKEQGFRYQPRSRAWTAKHNYRREELLKEMAGTVEDVNIQPDYQGKAEYYAGKASSTKAEADELYSRAKQKMDMIPFGQPILVGHHSEKRHRSDLDKISRGFEKSFETSDKAREYAERSERASIKAEGKENPVTILNRIEKMEKDLAKLKTYKGEESKHMVIRVEERLRQEREKYKVSGGIAADKMSFKVGDKIRTQFGPAIIKKVNKKTLRVDYLGGYQVGKTFWEDRVMDVKEVRGSIPHTSYVDPLLDQYVSSGNNLVKVEVKGHEPDSLYKELAYRIKDRGLDNKIKVDKQRDEVYLELVK